LEEENEAGRQNDHDRLLPAPSTRRWGRFADGPQRAATLQPLFAKNKKITAAYRRHRRAERPLFLKTIYENDRVEESTSAGGAAAEQAGDNL